MDSLQLKYFKVVAETLNISRAAQLLYVSQSSLSQTIKHLEAELGYPLFDRIGKRICLNRSGHVFLDFVNKVEQEYTSMYTQIEEINDQYQRTITLDIQCASLYLPQIMGYLKEKLPEVSFLVSQGSSEVRSDKEADVQLYASAELEENSNRELLLEEDILLALPKNHPLLEQPEICLKNLEGEEFICLNASWSLEKLINVHCQSKDVRLDAVIRVDNPDILRRLLCQNLGIAFIPEKTWGTDFANGMLELRKVADLPMKRYVYIGWKSGYLSRNTQRCIALIKEFFQECIE